MATILNGYNLLEDWKISPNGKYTFATKKGEKYFLKEFFSPVYPIKGKASKATYDRMAEECDKWLQHQKNLLDKLRIIAGATGTLVVPTEIFRNESKYYKATPAIDSTSMTVAQVAQLPIEKKITLLKSLTQSIVTLHRANIVHGDLKPENILITTNPLQPDSFITKTIDFDDSYFESEPPIPEETIGTVDYYSPELALYILTEDENKAHTITCKNDVFACGIIFHEYLTGKKPDLNGYNYAHETLLEKKKIFVYGGIRADLRNLINDMLDMDYNKRPSMEQVYDRLRGIDLSKMSTVRDVSDSQSSSMSSGPQTPPGIRSVVKQQNGQYKITYSDGRTICVPSFYLKTIGLEDFIVN